MSRLTKRTVEAFSFSGRGDSTLLWDQELKGFGVRAFPSGSKKFILQYRTRSGKQRRMTLGAFGPLTVERARELARIHLGKIAEGEDPADKRKAERDALTVATLCDRYMAAADAGLVLGRGGTPKKQSTIDTDRGRVERHIKPLIGSLKVTEIQQPDIEHLKNGIAVGKTATDLRTGRHGRAIVKGGRGTATRTLGLLGAIFQWGISNGLAETNPARGVRRFADKQKKALLSQNQYEVLGHALADMGSARTKGDQPAFNQYGLSCIRLIALTGLRRGEAVNLKWSEVDLQHSTLCLGDTKTGTSLRPLPKPAADLLKDLERISDFVFPAGPGGAPYSAVPKLWRKVVGQASDATSFNGITLHSLRHSFAGVAEECGASLPTIAALLGHRLGGVTAGYVLKRVDPPLVAFSDKVSLKIERMMNPDATGSVLRFPAQ